MNIKEVLQISPQFKDIHTLTALNVIYTSRVVEEPVNVLLKKHDLSNQQYNVLRILRGQKGKPASLACVQQRMIDKNSNTTRLIDKLITKDLAERRICPHNRRQIEIMITEAGLSLLKRLDPRIQQLHEEKTAKLSKQELETLNNLLDKLRS